MTEKHVPSEETARDCVLDGAAGEYLPEDWTVFLAHVRRDAWDECAEMAAHHGAFDGSATRWLSSINPYRIPEETS